MWQIDHAPSAFHCYGLTFKISSDRIAIADFSFTGAVLRLIYDE